MNETATKPTQEPQPEVERPARDRLRERIADLEQDVVAAWARFGDKWWLGGGW